ncbi:transposase [Sorangium sp. So ce1128]
MKQPYSDSFREKMVQRMLGPDAVSANRLAQQVGIHQSTLSRWLRGPSCADDDEEQSPGAARDERAGEDGRGQDAARARRRAARPRRARRVPAARRSA